MGLKDKLQMFALEQMIDKLCDVVQYGTDEDMNTIISIGEKLTTDPLWKSAVSGFKFRWQIDHPQMHMAKKFMREIDPYVRRTIMKNLIIKEALVGYRTRNIVRDEIGFYPPTFFVISPTMACNLSCYGCYARSYRAKGLDYELVEKAIREAKDFGVYLVIVSGGEPFYYPHILRMFEDNPDMVFQVYTNGTLIDRAMAQKIVELGNVIPAISIEGYERETDERRGKGVFKKIVQAMDYLREEGALFAFSATATKYNVETITSDEFIDFLTEKGVFFGWYFIYVPVGKGSSVELMLTPEQRGNMRKRIRQLRGTKGIFVADFWNDGDYVDGCIAGGRIYFHINSNGDIEPCVFTHFASHNIKEHTIREALDSPLFRAFRDRQPFHLDRRLPCAIIDANDKLEEIVKIGNAKPTHEGADEIFTVHGSFLRKLSEDYMKWLHEHDDDHFIKELNMEKEYSHNKDRNKRLEKLYGKTVRETALKREGPEEIVEKKEERVAP
ncbi:MAG: radical SAM protein [bacterium]